MTFLSSAISGPSSPQRRWEWRNQHKGTNNNTRMDHKSHKFFDLDKTNFILFQLFVLCRNRKFEDNPKFASKHKENIIVLLGYWIEEWQQEAKQVEGKNEKKSLSHCSRGNFKFYSFKTSKTLKLDLIAAAFMSKITFKNFTSSCSKRQKSVKISIKANFRDFFFFK